MRHQGRLSWRAFARDERGAAMVEFSIVAFLLLVMVFGMVDYGRYFLVRANLTNAVREGARHGAVLSESTPDTIDMRIRTRQAISWGPASWQDSGVVLVSFDGIAPNRRVRVKLSNYPFKAAVPLVVKRVRIDSISAEFRREQP